MSPLAKLANKLGFHYVFGGGKHLGNALLSRFPIVASSTVDLRTKNTLRFLVAAAVAVPVDTAPFQLSTLPGAPPRCPKCKAPGPHEVTMSSSSSGSSSSGSSPLAALLRVHVTHLDHRLEPSRMLQFASLCNSVNKLTTPQLRVCTRHNHLAVSLSPSPSN